MGGLILWLVIGVPILAAIQVLWPAILFFAVLWLTLKILQGAYNWHQHNAHIAAAQRRALITRADQQHTMMMRGDTLGGTYGDYLPPPGLRL